MKKILLFSLITFSLMASAQETEKKADKSTTKQDFKVDQKAGENELKLNVLFMVLGAFEGSYERILTDESSIGIAVGGSFNKDSFNYNYAIEPYFRYYFGRKPAAGFFVEGFGSLNSKKYMYLEQISFDPITTYKVEDKTHFGLGVSVGGKFITKNNIVFELLLGIGRNVTAPSAKNIIYNGVQEQIIGRGALSVGYRF